MAGPPRATLAHWAQYLGLRGADAFLQSFDLEQNYQTAGALGSLFYRLSGKRADRARENIARSFPEWDRAQVDAVTEASLRHMFQLFLVDGTAAPRLLTPDSWPTHARLGEMKGVVGRLVRQEPIVFITGHCGNWELLGSALSLMGFPMTAVARPLDNPLLNKWVMGVREARGARIVTKWGVTPVLQREIERGGRLGFIADQNAGDGGLFVPFFGRLASAYKSIALLAMRYEVPVAAGVAIRQGERFKYEVSIEDVITPDDWKQRDDPLYYITARYTHAIERMVRRAPEQYLWIHRRWKSRPKHEREGLPLPNRLKRQLAELEWLDQDARERLEQR